MSKRQSRYVMAYIERDGEWGCAGSWQGNGLHVRNVSKRVACGSMRFGANTLAEYGRKRVFPPARLLNLELACPSFLLQRKCSCSIRLALEKLSEASDASQASYLGPRNDSSSF